MNIRSIEDADYYRGHLQLYQQLTSINPDKISFQEYQAFIGEGTRNIFVAIDQETDSVVGSVTAIVERKLIHDLGKVGHIEDVVVDAAYRSRGLGKSLIEHAHAFLVSMNCYKTILNCVDQKTSFYEKCGFQRTGNCMSYYNI